MMRGLRNRALMAGAFITAFFLLALPAAHAEESQFAYFYTTDLLPKGAKESRTVVDLAPRALPG